jgi:polyisoprenoid-binding protein YceI
MGQSITKNRWYLAALLVVALVASQLTATAAPTTGAWSTDRPHTEINFSVKHFFTPVTGSFEDYEIALDYNAEAPEKSTVEARVKVASVNTGNEKRDNHLRSGDWFEAEKYPYITFKSTSVRKVGENGLVATGDLTIKGKSQQIELPITLLGNQMIPEQAGRELRGHDRHRTQRLWCRRRQLGRDHGGRRRGLDRDPARSPQQLIACS